MADSQTPKESKKAPWACQLCRDRKLRCDAWEKGIPCTRCRRSGRSCHEHAVGRRTRPSLSKNITNNELATTSSTTPSTAPLGNSNNSTALSSAKGETQSPSTKNTSRPSHSKPAPSSFVFYLTYNFLVAGNLHNVVSEDIDYLESQGCFLIPDRENLDDVVQQFFLHMHPFLPLFNEGDFWEMYYQRGVTDLSAPKMSLLVFQALMFTACNFSSQDTIRNLGFASARDAKASFYRKAKLLYDFESETSPVYIAQASLLLSFRAGPTFLSAKKTTWLSIAIRHAETANANNYETVRHSNARGEDEDPKLANTLKRLWWCCVIRDRVLPICFRRGIQIDRLHFNFGTSQPLCYTDLEDEIYSSAVYGPETKKGLLNVLEKFIELCIILTDILAVIYPLHETWSGRDALTLDIPQIEQAKGNLQRWKHEMATLFQDVFNRQGTSPAGSSDDQYDPVALYVNMSYVFCHSTSIALCHYELLCLVNSYDEGLSGLPITLQDCQAELTEAVSAITEAYSNLDTLKLARWLTSSAVACIATPLLLHLLDFKLLHQSTTPSDLESLVMEKSQKLKNLISIIKTCGEQYELVDFVTNAIFRILGTIRINSPLASSDVNGSYEWTSMASLNPRLYLLSVLILDLSFSKDKLCQRSDFPALLSQPHPAPYGQVEILPQHEGAGWPRVAPEGTNTGIGLNSIAISSLLDQWQDVGLSDKFSNFAGSTQQPLAPQVYNDVQMLDREAHQTGATDTYSSDLAGAMEGFAELDFNLGDSVDDVVGTLADLGLPSFVHDMIRAAL